jgi:ubiquinone/menaquinone biosynthesis C-methylase UbiE
MGINYFASAASAERYKTGRPDFHANTIEHIRQYLRLKKPVGKALDVACGTGLSTKALLPVADQVYGTDISEEMLRLAGEQDKIVYLHAQAEKLPFETGTFDLVTVCSGVHWFDVEAFLWEAYRVLKKGGWLVLYENFFKGEMVDVPAFAKWVSNVYLQRLPSPPRNKHYAWTAENLEPRGWRVEPMEQFTNEVSFTMDQQIRYFTTQSNVVAVVESGRLTYEDIENWLVDELTPFFGEEGETQTVVYGNWIRYFQKK